MVSIWTAIRQFFIVFFAIMALFTMVIDFAFPELGFHNLVVNIFAWIVGVLLLLVYVIMGVIEGIWAFIVSGINLFGEAVTGNPNQFNTDLIPWIHFDLGTLGILILETFVVLFLALGLFTIDAMILIPALMVHFIIILPLDLILSIQVPNPDPLTSGTIEIKHLPIIGELWNGTYPVNIDSGTRVFIPGLKDIFGLPSESHPAKIAVVGISAEVKINVWQLLLDITNGILDVLGFKKDFLSTIQDEVGIVYVLDILRAMGVDVDSIFA